MSIAKTLIQKEIERRKRGVSKREPAVKILIKQQKGQKNAKGETVPIDHSEGIKLLNGDIEIGIKNIKELETDLKKL